MAAGISDARSSRHGVRAWFERPRSRPGVARSTHPPSSGSVTVAGQALTACDSNRHINSAGISLEQVTELGRVADRVVAVAVVHEQVRLARLGGVLGDRRDELLELLLGIQVAKALGRGAGGVLPGRVAAPVEAHEEQLRV